MTGGPYASRLAGVGGVPTVGTDIPICAVFLVIFLCGAISHMAILQITRRRKHIIIKVSGMCFGYCMARIVTCIMRIVWATRAHNIRIGIAANIFSNAGVFIAFIINLIFAQRLFNAAYPKLAETKPFKLGYKALYLLTILVLAITITSIVQSFYTLDTYIHEIDRTIQLTASTIIFVIAALPLPLTLSAVLKARGTPAKPFGTGSWNAKVAVLLTTTLLAVTVAGFRCGTTWMTPHLVDDPYWFDERWCYYFFNFVFDVGIIYTYLFARVDKRFHVPSKNEVSKDLIEEHDPTHLDVDSEKESPSAC